MATSDSGAPYSKYIKLSNYFGPQSTSYLAYSSVVFFITPEISESRNVSYFELGDIRMPASLLIYMGSPSRNFNISAKFIARSQAEADVSFAYKSLLESWCVTGSSIAGNIASAVTKVTNAQQELSPQGADAQNPQDAAAAAAATGNPVDATHGTIDRASKTQAASTVPFTSSTNLFQQCPPVLSLEGYGGQFRRIPVVIRSLNITYPADVDYVVSSNNRLVPILQDITIGLTEARNIDSGAYPGSINSFNLTGFKQGTLQYW